MGRVILGVVVAAIFLGAITLDSLAGPNGMGLGPMFLGLALFIVFIVVLGFASRGVIWAWSHLRRG